MSQGTSLATDLRAARAAQQAGQAPDDIQRWLQRYSQAVAGRLPHAMKARGEERYIRLLLSEMMRTPLLMECLRTTAGENSLREAVYQMAQLGLEPGPLGHCYVLPFRDTRKGATLCTFILGYRGMIELAWRSQQIKSIQARVVYEGDIFIHEYGLGEVLRHIPGAVGPIEERTLSKAYALVRYVNGGHDFVVLDGDEVAFYRGKSRAANEPYSPWKQFEAAMWRKTAIRRLASEMPLTPEVAIEFLRDEARELGLTDDARALPVNEQYVEDPVSDTTNEESKQ